MRVVFDLGGTQLRVAASPDHHQLGPVRIVPTPADFTLGYHRLVETIRILAPGKIDGLAGGLPGPLDADHTMLANAPNLSGWNQRPLKMLLERDFATKVILENDAALVGLGEATVGAGRGQPIVAYVTVSTGVNGVRIVDGRIDRSARGFEIGHQVISSEPIICPGCGLSGHLEGLVGGRALTERFGRSPHQLRQTDPKIWQTVLHDLAIGLANTILYWSPSVVVLGGGIAHELDIDQLSDELAGLVRIYPQLPPVRRAALGEEGGLLGALAIWQSGDMGIAHA